MSKMVKMNSLPKELGVALRSLPQLFVGRTTAMMPGKHRPHAISGSQRPAPKTAAVCRRAIREANEANAARPQAAEATSSARREGRAG